MFATLGLGSPAADAQTPVTAALAVAGDFVGSLVVSGATLHLKLHIHAAADGTLSGTLDSPDQGAAGRP